MRRREFVALLGGLGAVWPLVGRAQNIQGMRRIGVLHSTPESDLEAKAELAAFEQELKNFGWRDGQNIRIDYRFGAGDLTRIVAFAKELVASKPDLVVARSTPVLKAVAAETKTIPIVFIGVSDPIGEGLATSLARPGGNVTGFTNVESAMAGKWVELLKDITPGLKRVAFLFNPPTAPGGGAYYARLVEGAAAALGVGAISGPVYAASDIDAVVTKLAHEPGGGLIALPDAFTNTHRTVIFELAMRHRLPAVYTFGHYAVEGGLIAYGANIVDLYRRSASYVDRILKGEPAGDLPIQAPAKFELMINLATARALGITVPSSLLARADQLLE
jgi:putative tryptophan/tyrosine transport system substrate-binding protein